MNKKEDVIVICGPTASGKTALSIELAKQINGEIISADSMQIYKYMDIGTSKIKENEKQGIKHYMLDIVKPSQRYSVVQYKESAQKAIGEIIQNKKRPIIVGGTGLYINSLIYNIKYNDINIDENYRKKLEERVKKEGLEKLYQEAYKIDKQATEKISKNDKKRILRIIEIYNQTGKTKTEIEIESRKEESKYNYLIYVLNWDREVLYNRINKRVDLMIEEGLIEEVKKLLKKYDNCFTSMQAIGYKEVVEYLNNDISESEMIEKIKQETRRYAKRQLTWFRKIDNCNWLDGKNKLQNNINIILEGIK